jgi:hypothetical protein
MLGALTLSWLAVPRAWLIALAMAALVLSELGFVRLPLPTRNWQMPNSWLRLGNSRSALLFGLTMGSGALTRAPMASFHGLILLGLLVASVPYGVVLGLLFAAGRAAPVLLAAPIRARSTEEVRWVVRLFAGHLRLWRLLGATSMAGIIGAALLLATAGVPLR